MRYPHGGFGLVDVLATGPAGPHRVDPQIGVVEIDINLLGERKNGHRRR